MGKHGNAAGDQAAARATRLAAALRLNLQRRKAQNRARAADPAAAPTGGDQSPVARNPPPGA